jgi:hypothetical protein
LPAEFVAEIEGKDPEARKRKRIEGNFGLEGYEPSDEVWYARTKAVEGKGYSNHGTEVSVSTEQTPEHATPFAVPQPAQEDTKGILSSSTLAALQGFQGNGIKTAPSAAPVGGPLVMYRSDDDSD